MIRLDKSRWALGGLLGTSLALSAFGAAFVVAGSALPANAGTTVQEAVGKIEAQYQAAIDPVKKAKLLAKLGPLETESARIYIKMDNEEKALATLEHYRDEVKKTADALAATNVSVERHPAGFKELQIGLRECILRMDDIIYLLPVDNRPWFEAVRSDLSATQTSLFDALFPTATEKKEKTRTAQ